jgi:hypothetical protein
MKTTKINRREVLAFITLADAPMPDEIAFHFGNHEMIALDLDDHGSVNVWAELFGLDSKYIRSHAWVMDGKQYSNSSVQGTWRGWPIRVECSTSAPVEELDDDTRAKLGEIAGESK